MTVDDKPGKHFILQILQHNIYGLFKGLIKKMNMDIYLSSQECLRVLGFNMASSYNSFKSTAQKSLNSSLLWNEQLSNFACHGQVLVYFFFLI